MNELASHNIGRDPEAVVSSILSEVIESGHVVNNMVAKRLGQPDYRNEAHKRVIAQITKQWRNKLTKVLRKYANTVYGGRQPLTKQDLVKRKSDIVIGIDRTFSHLRLDNMSDLVFLSLTKGTSSVLKGSAAAMRVYVNPDNPQAGFDMYDPSIIDSMWVRSATRPFLGRQLTTIALVGEAIYREAKENGKPFEPRISATRNGGPRSGPVWMPGMQERRRK